MEEDVRILEAPRYDDWTDYAQDHEREEMFNLTDYKGGVLVNDTGRVEKPRKRKTEKL